MSATPRPSSGSSPTTSSAPPAATGPRDGNEPTGLAHHWRLSTVAERTSDEHALLLTQLLDLDGLDIDEAVTGIAVTSSVPLVTANLRQMVARWFDVPSVVLEPGREERHAHPLRQPQGGRGRPDRQRGRRPRPVRRPVRGGRPGHGHHLRRHLGGRRVPGRGHHPRGGRSASTPCSPTPPPSAGSSWSSRGA